MQFRQSLGKDVTGDGVLDPAIIRQISAEAFPEVRDADELHDALLTVVRLPPVEEWGHSFTELERTIVSQSSNGTASRSGLLPNVLTWRMMPTQWSPAGWNVSAL